MKGVAPSLIIVLCVAPIAAGQEPARTDVVAAQIARLDLYVAPWIVTEQHFDRRGEIVATVKGSEEIVRILDDRALRRTYITATETTTYHAIGTLTWNEAEQHFSGVWFDNVSLTGPTLVKGTWDEPNRTMVYEVQSSAPDGSTQRRRVVERFVDDETRVATTYLIEGENLVKRLEVTYKRAIPCPGRLRTIDELQLP